MATRVEHLKSFHEILRATLMRAIREPGATGEAARKLGAIAEAHFRREEELVAPLLALLPALAAGDAAGSMAEAPALARALRQALEPMREEHRRIAEALRELARAARSQGSSEYSAFIEEMMVHAHTEETMLYPAAIVAGEYVALLELVGSAPRAASGEQARRDRGEGP